MFGDVVLSWIELEGACNVRDLGGLPAEGGVTRPGVLLRADALDALTGPDVAQLVHERGLAHVVDLRSGSERLERGRGGLGRMDMAYTELDVITDEVLVQRSEERQRRLVAGDDVAQIMADGYVHLLEVGATAFTAALEAIVAPGGTPALVHCSAGKDRTGVLVALLLAAAGVDRATIVADYAATGGRMERIVARLSGAQHFQDVAAAATAFSFGAPAATMEAFLADLVAGWGGAAGWFTAHGVAEADVTAWRQLVIEPSA